MTRKSRTSKPKDKAASEQEVVIHGPTLFMREMETRNAFLRREFLTPAGESLESSFVLAVVRSSHAGQLADGWNGVVLCDSTRIICLEFPLGTPAARNASLYKVGILLGTIERFREALLFEATAIENAGEGVDQK
jgi:hypothetical protein